MDLVKQDVCELVGNALPAASLIESIDKPVEMKRTTALLVQGSEFHHKRDNNE
jgi:hypothetical protein